MNDTDPERHDELAPPLTLDEQRLLAEREQWRQEQAERRARKRELLEAQQPSPDGVVFTPPKVPAGLGRVRKWVRRCHDAYSRGELDQKVLNECRRTAGVLSDMYRTGADIKRAEAAMRSAIAQERTADILASIEHGAAAALLLAKLKEAMADGSQRRPLPPMPPGLLAPGDDAA